MSARKKRDRQLEKKKIDKKETIKMKPTRSNRQNTNSGHNPINAYNSRTAGKQAKIYKKIHGKSQEKSLQTTIHIANTE